MRQTPMKKELPLQRKEAARQGQLEDRRLDARRGAGMADDRERYTDNLPSRPQEKGVMRPSSVSKPKV